MGTGVHKLLPCWDFPWMVTLVLPLGRSPLVMKRSGMRWWLFAVLGVSMASSIPSHPPASLLLPPLMPEPRPASLPHGHNRAPQYISHLEACSSPALGRCLGWVEVPPFPPTSFLLLFPLLLKFLFGNVASPSLLLLGPLCCPVSERCSWDGPWGNPRGWGCSLGCLGLSKGHDGFYQPQSVYHHDVTGDGFASIMVCVMGWHSSGCW